MQNGNGQNTKEKGNTQNQEDKINSIFLNPKVRSKNTENQNNL